MGICRDQFPYLPWEFNIIDMFRGFSILSFIQVRYRETVEVLTSKVCFLKSLYLPLQSLSVFKGMRKLVYIPNYDTQNYPFCRLQFSG